MHTTEPPPHADQKVFTSPFTCRASPRSAIHAIHRPTGHVHPGIPPSPKGRQPAHILLSTPHTPHTLMTLTSLPRITSSKRSTYSRGRAQCRSAPRRHMHSRWRPVGDIHMALLPGCDVQLPPEGRPSPSSASRPRPSPASILPSHLRQSFPLTCINPSLSPASCPGSGIPGSVPQSQLPCSLSCSPHCHRPATLI